MFCMELLRQRCAWSLEMVNLAEHYVNYVQRITVISKKHKLFVKVTTHIV